MGNVIYFDKRKREEIKFLESLVPKPFEDLDEFLGYCELHGKTEGAASFNLNYIYALYKMARYPTEDFPEPPEGNKICRSLPYETLEPMLNIIEKRRNFTEVKFK